MRSSELRRRPFIRTVLLLGLSLVAGMGGCRSVEPVAPFGQPITDPTQLYTRLTLDYPAVNLSTVAPYNVAHLTATPRDALDSAMAGLPAPTIRLLSLADTTKVKVTADGTVTALGAATGVAVVAELIVGPIRHADTALINVQETAPPVLDSLSIHPLAPDSAVWMILSPNPHSIASGVFGFSRILGISPSPQLVARATDGTGNPINDLQIEYTSLDPTIAVVDRRSSFVKLAFTGQVRMVARTFAYGVAKADTVTYTVLPPVVGDVFAQPGLNGAPTFTPSEIRLAPYGIAIWTNATADSVDVTFDGPAPTGPPLADACNLLTSFAFLFGPGPYCGTGDLLLSPVGSPDPDFGSDGSETTTQIRQFPAPGVYSFHSTRTGASGRIVVSNSYAD